MAPKQKNKKRKHRRPNVYTGGAPSGTKKTDANPNKQVENPVVGNHERDNSENVVETRRSRSVASQRNTRQAHARSEVFGRTLTIELRKISFLTVGIIIALVVLTMVL